MKAADISDEIIHAVISTSPEGSVGLHTMQQILRPYFPDKVVFAKLRQMVNKGRLSAQCICGCHGPYVENSDSAYGSDHNYFATRLQEVAVKRKRARQ